MSVEGAKRLITPGLGPELRLDRAAERRTDREWIAARLGDARSRFLLLVDLKLSILPAPHGARTTLRWYSCGDLARMGCDLSESLFAGIDSDGNAVFAARLNGAETSRRAEGEEDLKPLVDLRTLAMQGSLGPEDLAMAGIGRALAAWHDGHRCCGRCGSRTKARDAGWKRQCWACGQEEFPRSDPAVIVLVTHGERCLLGRHKRYAHQFYSVLAGFVEPGEDIENAVRREIREETGVKIGDVSYLASQPWPFPHSLMIGCRAEALSSELRLDEEELWDARWFGVEDVRAMLENRHAEGLTVPAAHSIAHSLIRAFVDEGR
ncbi:MAG: NAD(+) diphosphatase [Hyphomicrobiales bacterium]